MAVAVLVVALALLGARLLIPRLADGPARPIPPIDGPRGGCPETPNCVSSRAEVAAVAVAPLGCADPDALVGALRRVGAEVVARGEGRIHAVATTPVLRFPDDVWLDVGEDVTQVLSRSRLGSDDLGTNRDRVERLRAELQGCASG